MRHSNRFELYEFTVVRSRKLLWNGVKALEKKVQKVEAGQELSEKEALICCQLPSEQSKVELIMAGRVEYKR